MWRSSQTSIRSPLVGTSLPARVIVGHIYGLASRSQSVGNQQNWDCRCSSTRRCTSSGAMPCFCEAFVVHQLCITDWTKTPKIGDPIASPTPPYAVHHVFRCRPSAKMGQMWGKVATLGACHL